MMGRTVCPVLLLAFNRPQHTLRVFEAIRQAKPPRLYFAVDGPSREEQKKQCEEVQAIVNRVDWECEVHTLFREKNLGCSIAVTEAISWFFEREEEGIIFEDDCLPSPSFFLFCEKLLCRYRYDTRISIISGGNFLLGQYEVESDYYYSSMSHIWGWAAWRRTWEGYSLTAWDSQALSQSKVLEHLFGSLFLVQMLKKNILPPKNKKNLPSSVFWDYRFMIHNLMRHRVSVIPAKNLVCNIGFDSFGNSGGTSSFVYANLPAHSTDTSNLVPPRSMIPFYEGDRYTLRQEYGYTRRNFWKGIRTRMAVVKWLLKRLFFVMAEKIS